MMSRLPSRYNQLVVKRAVACILASLIFCRSLRAQDRAALGETAAGRTMVVVPFENTSPTPVLEWLGESFPEALHEQLNSPVL